MFVSAILTGLYGYLILLIGLPGFLSKTSIFFVTLVFLCVVILIYKKQLGKLKSLPLILKRPYGFPTYLLAGILLLLAIVNLIGALGPELAFDALWYHLTIPKLYLSAGSFYFIPGGTLYYSTMPQLTEMFYLSALALHSEILAKLVHFLFGLGICLSIYKLARFYLSKNFSLLAVLIFYSNLVVAWESTTAYIDLSRTFFEFISFFALVKWIDNRKIKWLVYSGLIIGLAISTKFLSLGTLGLLSVLIFYYSFKLKESTEKIFKNLIIFLASAIFVPLPWFIHAYINRGNPFYPMFSGDLQSETQFPSFNPLIFIKNIWSVFTHAADPVSPVYIVFLPLAFLLFRRFKAKERIFLIYSILSILLWYLTPQTGGGRFLLPFLPVFSILIALTLNQLKNQKNFLRISIAFIVLISLLTIGFRGLANKRYVKYILGKESKAEFLQKNLEFDYGNFADIDGYFLRNIKGGDRVLLYGFHNLYYVNFPFIDGSWVKKGDRFNFIAVKEGDLPRQFKNWKKIYFNELTKVRLYSNEGVFWTY